MSLVLLYNLYILIRSFELYVKKKNMFQIFNIIQIFDFKISSLDSRRSHIFYCDIWHSFLHWSPTNDDVCKCTTFLVVTSSWIFRISGSIMPLLKSATFCQQTYSWKWYQLRDTYYICKPSWLHEYKNPRKNIKGCRLT